MLGETHSNNRTYFDSFLGYNFLYMKNSSMFIKNFSTFFSGALIAQLVGFLLSPVLSRLYAPEDFAYFTVFTQIMMILTIFGGRGLLLMIPESDEEKDANITFQLVLIASIILSALIVGFSIKYASSIEFFSELWPYVAVGLVLFNLRGAYHYFSLSSMKLSSNSKSRIAESLVGSSSNVTFGFFGAGFTGLLISNFLGQFTFLAILKIKLNMFKHDSLKLYSKFEYKEFWSKKILKSFFQSLSHLIEGIFLLSFSLLISKQGSILQLGFFSFFLKVVNTPFFLMSEYLSQMALKRLVDLNSHEDKFSFYMKLSALLGGISLFSIIIIYFFGEEIFKFIFGEQWRDSGTIAKFYILGVMATFFIRSLQYVPNIYGKHWIYTTFSLFTFGLPVFVLYLAPVFQYEFIDSLKILSAVLLILAILYFVVNLIMLNSRKD